MSFLLLLLCVLKIYVVILSVANVVNDVTLLNATLVKSRLQNMILKIGKVVRVEAQAVFDSKINTLYKITVSLEN